MQWVGLLSQEADPGEVDLQRQLTPFPLVLPAPAIPPLLGCNRIKLMKLGQLEDAGCAGIESAKALAVTGGGYKRRLQTAVASFRKPK